MPKIKVDEIRDLCDYDLRWSVAQSSLFAALLAVTIAMLTGCTTVIREPAKAPDPIIRSVTYDGCTPTTNLTGENNARL